MNVQTNVAKKFQLLDKHFPPINKFHKILHRNNTRVSYSCMPNVASIIRSHNQKVLNPQQKREERKCNCKVKETCPLEGNCLTESLVYRANVTNGSDNDRTNYIGLTENTFKDRLYKHRNSFRYENKINCTELSKHVWDLRKRGITDETIKWSILGKAPAYKNGLKRCELCLAEKYHIIFQKYKLLNRRNKLLSNCRHTNKYLLYNFKEAPPNN